MSGSWLEKYGPVVGLMLGSKPHICVSGVREVMEALHKDELQGRPENFFDTSQRKSDRRLGEFRLEKFILPSR
jgi:hypothetical protein